MDDKQIMDLLFARSEQGVELLRTKYAGLCMGIALRNLGNPQDAEECFNDVLLKVWDTIPPNRPDSLTAYVGSLTRNASVDKFRQKTAACRKCGLKTALSELEECLPSGESVEAIADGIALRDCINRFLEESEQADRIIFLRRYWYANTMEEIAEMTGLSNANIRVKLHRMRKRLKDQLERNGVSL
ncbi:MAG: sigma-70 family RNA polymerase sigma factor [Clostridia bacterium]|nr:sigma-70 family RNA polymerase sigma factor [Clostridia bacterium]